MSSQPNEEVGFPYLDYSFSGLEAIQNLAYDESWMSLQDAAFTETAENEMSYQYSTEPLTDIPNLQNCFIPPSSTDIAPQSFSDASIFAFPSDPYTSCLSTNPNFFSSSCELAAEDWSGFPEIQCDSVKDQSEFSSFQPYTIDADDLLNYLPPVQEMNWKHPAAFPAEEQPEIQPYVIDADDLLNYLPPVLEMDWHHITPAHTPSPDHHVPGAWPPCSTPTVTPTPNSNSYSSPTIYSPDCFCATCIQTRAHAEKMISAIEAARKSMLVIDEDENAGCGCKYCVKFEEDEYEAAQTGMGGAVAEIETKWWDLEGR
jgi:hypothetical protein